MPQSLSEVLAAFFVANCAVVGPSRLNRRRRNFGAAKVAGMRSLILKWLKALRLVADRDAIHVAQTEVQCLFYRDGRA